MPKDVRRVSFNHIEHRIAHHNTTKRQVARGAAFCERDHVRNNAVVRCSKPRTQATKARDDFIENQQHAVLVTQFAQTNEISLNRGMHATGALHGFGDHRGDLRTRTCKKFFDLTNVVSRHLMHRVKQRTKALLIEWKPLHGYAAVGNAVVRVHTAYELVSFRIPLQRMSEPRQFQCSLDRFRT